MWGDGDGYDIDDEEDEKNDDDDDDDDDDDIIGNDKTNDNIDNSCGSMNDEWTRSRRVVGTRCIKSGFSKERILVIVGLDRKSIKAELHEHDALVNNVWSSPVIVNENSPS